MSSGGFRAHYTIVVSMNCPLCGTRRARRSCPALGHQICAVCCGTKRLVQIPCPADCVYLASAREHPAAAVVRQQQRDVAFVAHAIRDFSDRQTELFFLVATTLAGDGARSPSLGTEVAGDLRPRLTDDDVVDAATALAGTFETSSRGVIYEHRASSAPAERLVATLTPLVTEAGRGLGSSFERDAASVLRRIAEAARDARGADAPNERAFLELLGRVLARTGKPGNSGEAAGEAIAAPPGPEPSRLIVP
jgi:hypothetical protein